MRMNHLKKIINPYFSAVLAAKNFSELKKLPKVMKRRGGGKKAVGRDSAKELSASISDNDEGSQAEDDVDEEGDGEDSGGDDDGFGLFPDLKFSSRRRIGPSASQIVKGHYCG